MRPPSKTEVETLLDECFGWEVDRAREPTRGVRVSDLVQLASWRGYEPSASEQLADAVVIERGGKREKVHNVPRYVGNAARHIAGRTPIPHDYIWTFPDLPRRPAGGDDDASGVREPRRPPPSGDAAAAAVERDD